MWKIIKYNNLCWLGIWKDKVSSASFLLLGALKSHAQSECWNKEMALSKVTSYISAHPLPNIMESASIQKPDRPRLQSWISHLFSASLDELYDFSSVNYE